MKNFTMVGLLALALILGACGQKGSNGARASRGTVGPNGVSTNGGTPNVTLNPQQNPGYWGNISVQANSDQNIAQFLSSGNVQMGNVSTPGCQTGTGQPCQVDFNVSVNPGGSPPNYNPLQLTQISQSQYQVTSSGVLTVAVYDSLTGTTQPGVNGQLSAIGAPATLVSAQMVAVQGGYSAYLVFQNSAGNVIMGDPTLSTVNIMGQSFQGQITYQYNNVQGVLGTFSTSACYVFSCQ